MARASYDRWMRGARYVQGSARELQWFCCLEIGSLRSFTRASPQT
jgi:hypothetical protein